MTWFARGIPGSRPVFSCNAQGAKAGTGEVSIALDALPAGDMQIASDGKSLMAAAVSLADAKAAAWLSAKAYRATKTIVTTAKGKMQADDRSLQRLSMVAAAAQSQLANLTAKIDWTMSDNTIVSHTAAEIVTAANTVANYLQSCHAASQAVRTKIYAATTVAAVAAVDVTAGYPA